MFQHTEYKIPDLFLTSQVNLRNQQCQCRALWLEPRAKVAGQYMGLLAGCSSANKICSSL